MTRNGKRKLLFTAFLAASAYSFIVPSFSGGQLFGGESGNSPAALRPATPELLALYKERVKEYQKTADFIRQEVKAATVDQKEAILAYADRDGAKLAYWRREKNLHPDKGAAEAFINAKKSKVLLQLTEGLYNSNTIPPGDMSKAKAQYLDAEIRLEEALLNVNNKAAWDKAAKALDKYPEGVTDELLRALLDAELQGYSR